MNRPLSLLKFLSSRWLFIELELDFGSACRAALERIEGRGGLPLGCLSFLGGGLAVTV